MARKRSGRARKGTGTICERSGRFVAQVDLGAAGNGSRDRRRRTFGTRELAEQWLMDLRMNGHLSDQPIAKQLVADYLRWWLEHEAPKGSLAAHPSR